MHMGGLTETAAGSPRIYRLYGDTAVAALCAAGASIASVQTPDHLGRLANIALSLPNAGAYLANTVCAGAVVGPIAGRIQDGRVVLGGHTFQMPRGENGNCLHSGANGLQNVLWTVPFADAHTVVFQTTLPDGGCGLPGNRTFTARYALAGDTLCLTLSVTTDADTFVDPTSHAYWNLSGDFACPATQRVQLCAKEIWYNNAQHLPWQRRAVDGTAFDLRAGRPLAEAWQSDAKNAQLANANGWNNAYILSGNATLYEPVSGRCLTLETDAPSLVLYSGGYLDESLLLAGGQRAVPGCAYALEPQLCPDAPRLLGSALPLLHAGEVFTRTIRWRFSVAG